MFKEYLNHLAGRRANRLFLIAGILLTALALYKLVRTAMYVHESVVVTATVTDVRQQPFESTLQALQNGNLAMGESTSYQPIVRYTVPNGMVISRLMTDSDDCDYTVGQEIQVITPALDPSQAHIYKWKFIWGWECMQLGTGALALLLWLALRERKAKAAAAPASRAPRKKSGSTGRRKKAATEAAPRKRAPRKKKQA
jgi:hypothetical protein